jgi:NADPH:quinone reductase-like Zn-dependent oxidoreductase
MRAWQIISSGGIDALRLTDVEIPKPAQGQVRVKIEASSLNYRDLLMIEDPIGRNLQLPRVPNSDASGTITAVGSGVKSLREGDRVASCFFSSWVDGVITHAAMSSALGGALDGVLAEEVVLNADGVISLPKGYSSVQGSTLPCAALTAWHALFEIKRIQKGDRVLLLGTGGVSIFAMQFAVAVGAEVFIISSSDEKLARAKSMGAHHLINYKKFPNWERSVLELTNGVGVDLTVEVGGSGTVTRSIEATKVGGVVCLIGVLSEGVLDPTLVMRKSIRLQGIYVGSRTMFQEMNRAIDNFNIKPVIYQEFDFDSAPEAFAALKSQRHFGKLVIKT